MMIHIPLNNTFCSHARGILLTMLVSLFTIQNVSAKDDALYDGMYDRPSYFPDFTQPTTWPTTMSYFIYVRDVDGKKLSNYEVAVYDQDGILRTIGRSRKSQGELCTLTIPGVKGHTFTFKVLYGDFEHPTIVDATTEQEVAYKADAVVGGPANPFWLTIPPIVNVTEEDAIRELISPLGKTKDAIIYDMSGRRISNLQPGANIICLGKGKRKIIWIK